MKTAIRTAQIYFAIFYSCLIIFSSNLETYHFITNIIKVEQELSFTWIIIVYFFLFVQMFAEGDNLVSMNLPGRKELLERERQEEEARLAEIKRKKAEESVSGRDEYINEVYQAFSYTEEYEEEKEVYRPVIRDYSIETWNHRKGMKFWGYSEDHPEK